MESSRYWQSFGEVKDPGFSNGQGQNPLGMVCQVREKSDGGMVVYGGRLMSIDVYLKVPTFIRRGISIVV